MDKQSFFEQLPEEFKGAVSYMAYEQGHSAGQDEVEMLQESIAYDLLPSILKFEKRITQK